MPYLTSSKTLSRTAVLVAAACALLTLALMGPAPASADVVTFGSDLSATPTLDTANGAYSDTGSAYGPEHAVLPNPHEAEDTGLWNTQQASGSPVAAAGGQALFIKVKGCAIKDNTAPTSAGGQQLSVGTPVNTIVFQTLAPTGNGDYTATSTSGQFLMPFCSNSSDPTQGAVNTSTVTTFEPIHQCLAPGDYVTFHDVGGFMPPENGAGPWYPQGVPFDVIARVPGSTMAAWTGVGAATIGPGIWGPGDPDHSASGWSSQPAEEVMLQVVEGTGGDAYGLCPGGTAIEPVDGNTVQCDASPVPAPPYVSCPGWAPKTSAGRPSAGAGHPAAVTPKLSGVRLSAPSFRAAARTTITYQSNVAGRTTLRIYARLAGARRGRSCVARTRGLRRAKGCPRWVLVKTLTHSGRAGTNHLQLLDPQLAAGSYLLSATTTASGVSSAKVSVGFRVLAAAKPKRRQRV